MNRNSTSEWALAPYHVVSPRVVCFMRDRSCMSQVCAPPHHKAVLHWKWREGKDHSPAATAGAPRGENKAHWRHWHWGLALCTKCRKTEVFSLKTSSSLSGLGLCRTGIYVYMYIYIVYTCVFDGSFYLYIILLRIDLNLGSRTRLASVLKGALALTACKLTAGVLVLSCSQVSITDLQSGVLVI